MATYIALMRKDGFSDFGVDFPDFPGCVTAGRTLEEARSMAAEALALHVEGLVEDGEALPRPLPLDAVMALPEHRDAVAFLVDVAAAQNQAVRIDVTLPTDLLAAIDRRSTDRSAFLADAARSHLLKAG